MRACVLGDLYIFRQASVRTGICVFHTTSTQAAWCAHSCRTFAERSLLHRQAGHSQWAASKSTQTGQTYPYKHAEQFNTFRETISNKMCILCAACHASLRVL